MAQDDLIRFLRDADDIVNLVTGKRIPNLVKRGVELFGGEAEQRIINALRRKPSAYPDSPYTVLGVRPDASDIVIKASYRALVKVHHPDMGGDPEKFKAIQTAYETISRLREW